MTIFDIYIYGIHIAPSYYGLMYALGFLFGYYYLNKKLFLSKNLLDDLLIYIIVGVILGGRIGYILFYNSSYFLTNPLDILKVWEGGMSFHGGVIGVLIAMLLFAKIKNINFYNLADNITLVLPVGLGLGRIGNYLNKELLGFDNYYGFLSVNGKFPSPLVEALLEGLVLFIILYIVNKNKKFNGQIAALFLIFYAIFRIFVESVFREPDSHIGYIMGFLTMGEILSLPMLLFGFYYYFKLKNAK